MLEKKKNDHRLYDPVNGFELSKTRINYTYVVHFEVSSESDTE